jgi:hypothetical protein
MPVTGVRVAVGNTPVDIVPSTLNVPENSSVFINNSHATLSAFLGGPTVAASGGSTGYELKALTALGNPMEISQETRVFAIAATVSQLDLLIFTPY